MTQNGPSGVPSLQRSQSSPSISYRRHDCSLVESTGCGQNAAATAACRAFTRRTNPGYSHSDPMDAIPKRQQSRRLKREGLHLARSRSEYGLRRGDSRSSFRSRLTSAKMQSDPRSDKPPRHNDAMKQPTEAVGNVIDTECERLSKQTRRKPVTNHALLNIEPSSVGPNTGQRRVQRLIQWPSALATQQILERSNGACGFDDFPGVRLSDCKRETTPPKESRHTGNSVTGKTASGVGQSKSSDRNVRAWAASIRLKVKALFDKTQTTKCSEIQPQQIEAKHRHFSPHYVQSPRDQFFKQDDGTAPFRNSFLERELSAEIPTTPPVPPPHIYLPSDARPSVSDAIKSEDNSRISSWNNSSSDASAKSCAVEVGVTNGCSGHNLAYSKIGNDASSNIRDSTMCDTVQAGDDHCCATELRKQAGGFERSINHVATTLSDNSRGAITAAEYSLRSSPSTARWATRKEGSTTEGMLTGFDDVLMALFSQDRPTSPSLYSFIDTSEPTLPQCNEHRAAGTASIGETLSVAKFRLPSSPTRAAERMSCSQEEWNIWADRNLHGFAQQFDDQLDPLEQFSIPNRTVRPLETDEMKKLVEEERALNSLHSSLASQSARCSSNSLLSAIKSNDLQLNFADNLLIVEGLSAGHVPRHCGSSQSCGFSGAHTASLTPACAAKLEQSADIAVKNNDENHGDDDIASNETNRRISPMAGQCPITQKLYPLTVCNDHITPANRYFGENVAAGTNDSGATTDMELSTGRHHAKRSMIPIQIQSKSSQLLRAFPNGRSPVITCERGPRRTDSASESPGRRMADEFLKIRAAEKSSRDPDDFSVFI